jgi:hypothetical protein
LTIVLAAILGIPAGILFSEHLRGALQARDYTVAMNLARHEMEQLDSFDDFFHPDLALPADPAITNIVDYQGYPYMLRRTVDCFLGNCTNTGTGSQGVKRITITVYKSDVANPPPNTLVATIVTYRTKHVFFGG